MSEQVAGGRIREREDSMDRLPSSRVATCSSSSLIC